MTDRIMLDGINSLAAGIHRQFPNAAMVAGYLNGSYAWSQADWDLFPPSARVQITITASANAGDVLDVERGDANPAQAGPWIAMRKAAGYYRPTIYCSRSVIPAVRAGTGSYILGKDYDIWVADYTGTAHQVTAPGTPSALCAATQYESTSNYDASVVYDSGWPHRKAPVVQPPAPPHPAAPTGLSGTPHETVNLTWASTAGKSYLWQLATGPADAATLAKAGDVTAAGPVVHVSVDAGTPGPLLWRAKELPDGSWTVWERLPG